MKKERKETLLRIPIFIVSGIIFWAWGYLICVFVVFNFIYTLITGKRQKEIADLSEIWNTQMYVFKRYIIFQSNKRPFPFTSLTPSMSKFQK